MTDLTTYDVVSNDYFYDHVLDDTCLSYDVMEALSKGCDVNTLLGLIPEELAYRITHDTDWLDVNEDYDDVEKHYPIIRFDTKDGRLVVSPKGFVKYMMSQCGITDVDVSDIDDESCDDTGVAFVYRDMGWTWIDTGATSPVTDVCYYTFGDNHKICDYVVDTEDCW